MLFTKAVRMPFQSPKKFLIGWLLSMIPIVNFVTYGYALKCANNTARRKFKLPEWNNFLDLFIKGFLYDIIVFIYFLPTVVISAFFFVSVLRRIFTLPIKAQGLSPEFVINSIKIVAWQFPIMFLTLLILFILTSYIVISAVIHYSRRFNFREAFHISSVLRFAFSKDYFISYIFIALYALLLIFIVELITRPLLFIPFISDISNGFIMFILLITQLSLFGSIYSDNIGEKKKRVKKQNKASKKTKSKRKKKKR